MTTAIFTVPLRDLESGDHTATFAIPSQWLDSALQDTEASGRGVDGTLEAYLKKNGTEVYVRATARAALTMPCARTLEPVDIDLATEIVLLLGPKPNQAGDRTTSTKPPRRPKRRSEGNEDELLTAELAAEDFFEGETIVLDEFVREHLILDLPLFPVRSDLPFQPVAATDTPPDAPGERKSSIDPRLAPLAALARQLQRTPKE